MDIMQIIFSGLQETFTKEMYATQFSMNSKSCAKIVNFKMQVEKQCYYKINTSGWSKEVCRWFYLTVVDLLFGL